MTHGDYLTSQLVHRGDELPRVRKDTVLSSLLLCYRLFIHACRVEYAGSATMVLQGGGISPHFGGAQRLLFQLTLSPLTRC